MTAQRRGFFVTDALIGLFLIVALAAALAAATSRQIRASRSLADEREAIRRAEQTLTLLQLRDVVPDDPSTRIDDLGDNWRRVTATVRGRSAQLIGRVP